MTNKVQIKKKENYTTFYILRHGETLSNKNSIRAGQLDFPLSDTGIEQARQRARELINVHFDFVFSSDLSRAKQTTDIIIAEHNLAVKTNQLLRERHWGTFQGKHEDELQELHTVFNQMSQDERINKKLNPLMETSEEIIRRLTLFLRETAIAYPGKTILVGTHGNLMRTFLEHIGLAPYHNIKVENTGYFILLSDGIDFFIQGIKDIQLRK